MNNEQIKEVIANNGKFNEMGIQFLIDEIEYYDDQIEEQREQVLDKNPNFDAMLALYTEYSKNNQKIIIERKAFDDELAKINEKIERLGNRVSKKDEERIATLKKNIADIDEELNNSKLNTQEAKSALDAMVDERIDEETKATIQGFQKSIDDNKANIKEIYDYCSSEMSRIDSSIDEVNAKITEQSNVIASIKVENYGSVDEYNQEMESAINLMQQYQQELSQYLAYRNDYYYDHQRVVNIVNNANVIEVPQVETVTNEVPVQNENIEEEEEALDQTPNVNQEVEILEQTEGTQEVVEEVPAAPNTQEVVEEQEVPAEEEVVEEEVPEEPVEEEVVEEPEVPTEEVVEEVPEEPVEEEVVEEPEVPTEEVVEEEVPEEPVEEEVVEEPEIPTEEEIVEEEVPEETVEEEVVEEPEVPTEEEVVEEEVPEEPVEEEVVEEPEVPTEEVVEEEVPETPNVQEEPVEVSIKIKGIGKISLATSETIMSNVKINPAVIAGNGEILNISISKTR